MRILAALFLVFFLSACGADRTNQQYLETTAGQTLSDWRSANVWGPTWVGVIANAIPGLHVIGLIFDTIYVVSSIDDLIYGNGAIISRETGCEGLVQKEDYNLYFAWAKDGRAEVDSAFRAGRRAYDAKEAVGDVTQRMLDDALKASRGVSVAAKTSIAAKVVRQKSAEKLAYKIGGKITVKVIAKAFVGFAPVIGPAAAGIINYVILNDIDKTSRAYYRNKANIMCGPSSF